MPQDIIILVENTVIDIDDLRIGVSNIFDDTWSDQQGQRQQSVRCTISIISDNNDQDSDIRAAAGDLVVIGAQQYRLAEIKDGDVFGSVRLEYIGKSDGAKF